jgi:hypothetical protein
MSDDLQDSESTIRTFGVPAAYFFIILLVFVSLAMVGTSPALSQTFVTFYSDLLLAGMILLGFMVATKWIFGGVGLDTRLSVFIVIVWIVFIFAVTATSGQIIGVPNAVTLEAAPTFPNNLQVIYSSLYPAFGEDYVWLLGIPYAVIFFILGVLKVGFGAELGLAGFLGVAFLAAIIGGTLFTSAHMQAFQEQRIAFVGAWIFGVGQSFVYITTGFLVPVAHMLHNAIIKSNELFGISAFGFFILGPGGGET